jgi:hypothetical protein
VFDDIVEALRRKPHYKMSFRKAIYSQGFVFKNNLKQSIGLTI